MITSDKTRVHPMPCIASPRFPTVKEVASCLSISVSTVWRHAKEDETFPRPLKIGVGATRWAVTEIEAYEGSRKLTH
jgi:predicted DNA-binding transcriptional regulator AlpA